MPRMPRPDVKQRITVIVNGGPIAVMLHPPVGARSCWYAYWAGAKHSRSTGHAVLENAIVAAEHMVRTYLDGSGEGKRPQASDGMLTDEEFKGIQRAHFERNNDPAARARAAKSIKETLDAIDAFRAIIDMDAINFKRPIAAASPDVCAAFQRQAQTLPRNWRKQYPKSKPPEQAGKVRANTVLKWTRCLQAAFQRVNANAGKKCVRGVVPPEKLLKENPWSQFTSIKGEDRPLRQFSGDELLSFQDYLKAKWSGVRVAALLAKVYLWSQGRRMEAAALSWSQLRTVGDEYHFEVVGKWGVEKWFRVPLGLYQELLSIKSGNPYVFAAYNQQLRNHYEGGLTPRKVQMVGDVFKPVNLGDWFHERIVEWSESTAHGHATAHVFRKTALQYALNGENTSRVAADARVSEGVMMRHYTKVTDPARRDESNRTFARIAASLESEVASRYGYDKIAPDLLVEKIKAATESGDWEQVVRLSTEQAARCSRSVG